MSIRTPGLDGTYFGSLLKGVYEIAIETLVTEGMWEVEREQLTPL
jgi:hypothetical protein